MLSTQPLTSQGKEHNHGTDIDSAARWERFKQSDIVYYFLRRQSGNGELLPFSQSFLVMALTAPILAPTDLQ